MTSRETLTQTASSLSFPSLREVRLKDHAIVRRTGGGGGGVLPEKLGEGLRQAS